jgi:hypothetical protein
VAWLKYLTVFFILFLVQIHHLLSSSHNTVVDLRDLRDRYAHEMSCYCPT